MTPKAVSTARDDGGVHLPGSRIHRSHIQAGWRVTVPAAVRLHLEIGSGDTVEFVARDGVVEIRRADDEGAVTAR